MRRLAAEGTAIVYVSHRLPEILDLADRVTILRDGIGRGTYEISEALSEKDLIALMVGRSIEAEYPQKGVGIGDAALLGVAGLSGGNFRDVSFSLRRGEILGFAGAEGNGQRDAIRALGRPSRIARATVAVQRQAGPAAPRRARPSTAGCCSSAPTARRNRYSRSSACART